MSEALSFTQQEETRLISLLDSSDDKVRCRAIKEIGRCKSLLYLEHLYSVATCDESTLVRREAVSSIGRMRRVETIPYLLEILEDSDPKIVCQAVRGLLIFKGRDEVDSKLKALINHQNETVHAIIHKAYYEKEDDFFKENTLSHSQTYSFLKNKIVHADVRDVLHMLPKDSIHLTFTSPPYYNARDYSIYPSYEAYLSFLEEVFLATHRVTKEGRFLIVNTSPVIIPRVSRSHSSKRYPIPFDLNTILTKMGWDFIDDIVWMKPEYSVKNRIGGFGQHRNPLSYKPNAITEYLLVYRKHTDKLLDWNIKQYDATTIKMSKVEDGFESTNVWQIAPRSDKVHSAIFPESLCQRVITYYSFKGDLVFDPFAGSGTVGRGARMLGRNFFLTEKEQKYFDYMKTLFAPDLLVSEDVQFFTLDEFKENIK